MIHDIKSHFLTPEVYEIYSLCMYTPTYEKFAKKAQAYLSNPGTAIYGFYEVLSFLVSLSCKPKRKTPQRS